MNSAQFTAPMVKCSCWLPYSYIVGTLGLALDHLGFALHPLGFALGHLWLPLSPQGFLDTKMLVSVK